MWHVTVRMAWHDRGWDGKICDDPIANTYCTGTNSLLSQRLAREKRTDIEAEHHCQPLDSLGEQYLPPCYWTSCAFSAQSTKVIHRHPFGFLKDKKQIKTSLPKYSVYTWPFRLAMTKSPGAKKKHGNYFSDLETRIDNYCERLSRNKSLIFFYLNYDNPVSADDYQYALVGCARVADFDLTGHFKFSKSELEELRADEPMKNFPTLNWALRLTHKGPGDAVRLPYQEYVRHVEKHPEDEPKLKEMRVVIEEAALLQSFKYVSEQINDDQCLALLYKLRKAFALVEKHGIVDPGNAIEILDDYISQAWENRGLYPGLGSVVSVLADLAEGEPEKESLRGQQFVDALVDTLDEGNDLLDTTFKLFGERGSIPDKLRKHSSTIRDARAGLRDNSGLTPALRKLSLFALTPRQVTRILFPDGDGSIHAFDGRPISAAEIAENPYLLCEAYVPATEDDKERNVDLDRERRTDGPIDYFTVDIGMFPDRKHLVRNDELQNLTVAGPERLRAFAFEALQANEKAGHSYASLDLLVEAATGHPLFYKDSIVLRPEQFLSDEHIAHFRQRCHISEIDGQHFFYLEETKEAEEAINRYIHDRLRAPDHRVNLGWVDSYLEQEANELKKKITDFDSANFKIERRRQIEGALLRRFFVVTGRPGSGKTQALHNLLDHLDRAGETAVVLAPTGKAALRLSGEAKAGARWKAETIARWMHRSGLADYLDGHVPMQRSEHYVAADNIVIDEMSMVDLHHLALLFRALELHQPGSVKRIILVGDENQLPPIGCGRPFYDIVQYLREDSAREQRHIVRLTTNCRQERDQTVLDAAHLFAGKNRYHTELYERLLSGGEISAFLDVAYWETPEQLQKLVHGSLHELLKAVVSGYDEVTPEVAFNRLLKLYDKGYVPNGKASELDLDRGQILSPYRGGPSGALGLSDLVRSIYRRETWPDPKGRDTAFGHSDKVIRIANMYRWDKEEGGLALILSNGSIGVVCDNKWGRQGYFPERQRSLAWSSNDEENFELAYGITVHKAQGSEFEEVIVVIPERRALLSRELIYTALTRSKTKLTLLVQQTPRGNPLQIARDRSALLSRNSSIFTNPFDAERIFEPEKGVKVKSKIEYLIYRSLQDARGAHQLTFEYEPPFKLPLDGRLVEVHPDFVIHSGGKTFYWEHLGMLDRQDYSQLWRSRRKGYEQEGLADALITTDDMNGVRQDRIQQVVQDLMAGQPSGTESEFSKHHYNL